MRTMQDRTNPVVCCPRCGSRGLFRNHDEISCMSCSHVANQPAVPPELVAPVRRQRPSTGPAWTEAERSLWA